MLNKRNDKGIRSVGMFFQAKCFAQMQSVCVFKIGSCSLKHLIDKAIKFSLALLEYMAFFKACVPMGFQEMFSNHRVIIFNNRPMKVSDYIAVVV